MRIEDFWFFMWNFFNSIFYFFIIGRRILGVLIFKWLFKVVDFESGNIVFLGIKGFVKVCGF